MRISDWSSDVCSSDLGLLSGLWRRVALFWPRLRRELDRGRPELGHQDGDRAGGHLRSRRRRVGHAMEDQSVGDDLGERAANGTGADRGGDRCQHRNDFTLQRPLKWEESREGKECGIKCRSMWTPTHSKKKK